MANASNDIYFASYQMGDPRYLDALLDKLNSYRQYIGQALMPRWQKAVQNYYGISSDGNKSSQRVTRGGEQGELSLAKVADYRNILQHQLILITSDRPAGNAKAINSDPASLAQARIGSMLVEYYLSQVGYEQNFIAAAERAILVDESFTVFDWDATAGDPVRPQPNEDGSLADEAQNMMSGDMVMRVFSPWNMARDPYMSSPSDMKWGIGSWRMNKYELAAKYPNKADAILNSSNSKVQELTFSSLDKTKSDQIEVHCLWHDKTPVCKGGRITLFIGTEVLLDGDFPYKELNIYRMSQNESLDSCFGYTNNNDLLALEEATDALHSIVLSNNIAFGSQAILGPKGANLDHTQLAKGFAYFEVDPAHIDKIRPLQLTKSSPETYKYIEMLDRKKESLGGVNSFVRNGGADMGKMSGSAYAIIQAQSIQFQSGGQRSWYQLLSKGCTGMILMLQRFATSERVIRITGKVQGQYLQEFKYTSDDLEKISAVTFEMTNPLEKTLGGKETIADNLLQHNLIKNARQYLTLYRTGSLDAFTEDDEADEMGVKAENERLREGRPVQVVITENHEEHIQTHGSLIASPESKENAALVQATTSHILEHIEMWKDLSVNNPALLIATRQKVLPMPPQMGGPQPPGMPPQGGPPQGPPGPKPPIGPPPGAPGPRPPIGPQHGPINPEGPTQQKTGQIHPPNLPKPPVNPMTHKPAPLPPGTNVS